MKILVCQHVAFEVLGTLDPLFRNSGFRIRYVNFGRFPHLQPNIEGYDGLVVLGGPMNVDQTDQHPHLKYELTLIENAIKKDLPVLGICLGSQLIAKALGARVYANPQKEIGWYDVSLTKEGRADPLFTHFKNQEKLFQWHGDTFDLPKGAVHLAESNLCKNQAFRYQDKVYGLQFHLEVDSSMIERWLTVPVNQAELEHLRGKIDPQTIREQTPKHIAHLNQLSNHTFDKFIKLFGAKNKYKRLSSR